MVKILFNEPKSPKKNSRISHDEQGRAFQKSWDISITRIENGMPCRMETMRKILLALGYKISDKNKVFFD